MPLQPVEVTVEPHILERFALNLVHIPVAVLLEFVGPTSSISATKPFDSAEP